ncbi:MAG: hypothetical protein Q7J85_06330 [Bacillota bacterium]|nr:hypothetical protein [Bacillota bacterium]
MLTDAGNDPPYPPEFKLEAVRLVKAALTLFGLEEDGEEIPAASDPSTLDLNQPGAFVTLVSVYMSVVRAEMAHQFVRKTVTLPKWLNDVAETAGINFSRSLQTAIRPEGIASGLD